MLGAVVLFADYTDPFSYLLSHRIKRLEEEFDIEADWLGFEVCPDPMPIPNMNEARYQDYWVAVTNLARQEKLQLEVPLNPVRTRLAWRGAEYARDQGKSRVYHRTVFRCHFRERLDISDLKVLRGVAEEVGLDSAAFDTHVAASEDLTSRMQEGQGLARKLQIDSVPVCFIGGRRIPGVLPYGLYRRELVKYLTGRLALKPKRY